VLAVEDGKALIITDKIIGFRVYHNTWLSITWANCELRKYLNGDFYDSFSEADRARIAETRNVNKNNQHWNNTPGGADTTDKIFLLSLEEVVEYFGDSGQLANMPSDALYIDDSFNNARIAYAAKAHTFSWGETVSAGTAWNWWLRSPGGSPNIAAFVGSDGHVGVYGSYVVDASYGLRPALWLNLG
jgi:hypothetical protein